MMRAIVIITALLLSSCVIGDNSTTKSSEAVKNEYFNMTGKILLPDGVTPLADTEIRLLDTEPSRISLSPSTGSRFGYSRTDQTGEFKFRVKVTPSLSRALNRGKLGLEIAGTQGGDYVGIILVNSDSYNVYVLESISQFR